jgi:hypothetical protein
MIDGAAPTRSCPGSSPGRRSVAPEGDARHTVDACRSGMSAGFCRTVQVPTPTDQTFGGAVPNGATAASQRAGSPGSHMPAPERGEVRVVRPSSEPANPAPLLVSARPCWCPGPSAALLSRRPIALHWRVRNPLEGFDNSDQLSSCAVRSVGDGRRESRRGVDRIAVAIDRRQRELDRPPFAAVWDPGHEGLVAGYYNFSCCQPGRWFSTRRAEIRPERAGDAVHAANPAARPRRRHSACPERRDAPPRVQQSHVVSACIQIESNYVSGTFAYKTGYICVCE